MTALIANVKASLHGKIDESRLAKFGHRISGLGVVLFFLIHMIDTSFVYLWPQGYERTLRLFQSPLFLVGEIVLVMAVIYHGLNGLRTALMDWRPSLQRHHRPIILGMFGLVVLLYIPVVVIMGGHAIRALRLLRGG
jgi:succinate dehydrogenase / fumarate reductase cytochrome b subunit